MQRRTVQSLSWLGPAASAAHHHQGWVCCWQLRRARACDTVLLYMHRATAAWHHGHSCTLGCAYSCDQAINKESAQGSAKPQPTHAASALPGASFPGPAWQPVQPAATDMFAAPADMTKGSEASGMMGSVPLHTALANNAVKHPAATTPVPLSTAAPQSPQLQASAACTVSVQQGTTQSPAFAVAKGLAVPRPGMTPLSDVLAAAPQPSVHAALRGYVKHGAHKRAKQG